MKQITDRDGGPDVFYLYGVVGKLRLHADYARPGRRWDSDARFVFRLRQAA